jgi:hypothetical protein
MSARIYFLNSARIYLETWAGGQYFQKASSRLSNDCVFDENVAEERRSQLQRHPFCHGHDLTWAWRWVICVFNCLDLHEGDCNRTGGPFARILRILKLSTSGRLYGLVAVCRSLSLLSLEFFAGARTMAATQYSVAEIVVYPVKACKGISVSSAGISSTGN